MRPAVSVGAGGCLQLISSPMGPRIVSQDLSSAMFSSTDVVNEYNATLTPGAQSDYWESLWGGPMSMLPMNTPHKPGAFYHGDFYFYKHTVALNRAHFLLKFDGSGIFSQGGSTNFANNSLSGPGSQLLSPSGTSTEIRGGPMCVIPHNGSIFYVGTTTDRAWNTSSSAYINQLGWDTGASDAFENSGDDAGTGLVRRRAYCSYYITKKPGVAKEKKGFGKLGILYKRTGASGLASTYEDLNACDAISWGDDIIYANNLDIVHFPGGSGTPRYIEAGSATTSKCFEPHPSGGFNQTTGSAIGDSDLLVLTGSGIVKKIKFQGDPGYNPSGFPFGGDIFNTVQGHASGYPFGTTSIANLGSLVSNVSGPKVRTSGPRGRVGSTTENPDRSCLLKVHGNRLHAFFISKASGYYHFTCEGDPRTLTNWTDRTTSLPTNLKIRDGNIFGFRDEHFGTLNILHTAYSNIGAFGTQGGNTGAGGWTLYQLNENLQWNRLYHGASNGPPVGLIPYNPEGVYVQVPSGSRRGVAPGNPNVLASTDYAEVDYSLFSHRKPNRFADVIIEYTTDNGATWNRASRFKDYVSGALLGSGTTNLEASPEGMNYTFFWAHVKDLGFNYNQGVKLRVRPTFLR